MLALNRIYAQRGGVARCFREGTLIRRATTLGTTQGTGTRPAAPVVPRASIQGSQLPRPVLRGGLPATRAAHFAYDTQPRSRICQEGTMLARQKSRKHLEPRNHAPG